MSESATDAAQHDMSDPSSPDKELVAIQALLNALSGLEDDARQRVVDYVFQRLGLATSPSLTSVIEPPTTPAEPQASSDGETRVQDIRALKEQKKPRSANEMAALVAYYLSELAPQADRMHAITSAEITKYFKQAGYPLPSVPRQTLFNAKAAGYFDAAAEGGYKLNPVGYNLVAHALPADGESGKGHSSARKAASGRGYKKK